jgi:diguanylate cyclase
MPLSQKDLRRALDQERFVMFYQPQACTITRKTCGVEALVRLRNWDGSMVPPDDFIPSMESSGLMEAMTDIVVRQVVRDYQVIKAHGWGIPVGVNISARDLIEGNFIPKFLAELESRKCEADSFVFEITESSMVDDYAKSVANVALLKSIGARISIDDFGTGHASCKYIRHFPMDEIKIDRQFVAGITSNIIDRTIVEFVVDMGHKLGCHVIAEGVEDEATADMLKSMGCDCIQGYWYAKPMNMFDLVEFINGYHL